MNIFEQIRANISNIETNLGNMLVQAMVENESQIVDLNISQIEQGVGADGAILGEYASAEYADLKQSMGSQAPPGVVDLKLTGDFLEAFYAEPYVGSDIDSSGLFIDSRDEKTEMLESKYTQIFGIAPDNVDQVQDLILESLTNKIQNEITKL